MPRHPPWPTGRPLRSGAEGRTSWTDQHARRYSIGIAVDWFFFVFAGPGGGVAGVPEPDRHVQRRLVGIRLRPRVLGASGVPRAASAASHPHHDLRARLLHRPGAHERRTARRPGQPRLPRRGGADPRGDGRGRVDAGRPGDAGLVVADRVVDADPAQLWRGPGQPAVPVQPPAGLRVPAGGRRQSRPAPPRAVLEMSGRLASARRHRVDWLAAGTFDTAVGLSLFTLQVTHRIDADTDIERDHIVQTVTSGDARVAGDRSSRTSRRAITPATAAATASAPTANLPIVDVRPLPVAAP